MAKKDKKQWLKLQSFFCIFVLMHKPDITATHLIKSGLLAILILFLNIPCEGQEIDRILLFSKKNDEPPTKQGQLKYTIEFKRQSNGDFVALDYFVGKKKKRLNEKVKIEKEKIRKIEEWQTSGKKNFNILEFDLNQTNLKAKEKLTHYNLNFEIPPNITLSIDSFNLCQGYLLTKCLSSGGWEFNLSLIYKSGQKQEYTFDPSDMGQGKFNLKGYIIGYYIFRENLPSKFPNDGFFLKDTFEDIILHYQKIVECEGFYYEEYVRKNPNMTNANKRMKNGWNFIEYMKQRNKKRIDE